VRGLEAYGVHSIGQSIHAAAEVAAHALPFAAGPVKWTVMAFLSGIVGLLIGAVSIPIIGFAFASAWKLFKASYASAKGRERPSATLADSPASSDHDE
jgi:hypothetical protein